MTVKELYEWAVKNGVEDYVICVDARFEDNEECTQGYVQGIGAEPDPNHFTYYFNAQEVEPCVWLNCEGEIYYE